MPHSRRLAWQGQRQRAILDLRPDREIHRDQCELSYVARFWSCLAGVPSYADAESDVNSLFGSMAAALAEVNVPEFMDAFDKNMPGYEQLKSEIEALVNQAEVSSSVEPLKNEGNDAKAHGGSGLVSRSPQPAARWTRSCGAAK